MSSRTILSVGVQLCSDDVEHAELKSKTSLLDWDIVIVCPDISVFINNYVETYQGKPRLNDSASFSLSESYEHWRREIKQAFETGKTVFIFLPEIDEVYVATGDCTYSGTGRNQRTTRIVQLYDNYKLIPATLTPVSAQGTLMKLAQKGADILSGYWKEFEDASRYHVTLNHKDIPASLVTRNGDKPVGAIYRSSTSSGALLLMPNIDFYSEEFFDEDGDWTEDARQFAARFISAIVEIDKALRSTSDITPEPAWASAERFEFEAEATLRAQLLEAESQVEQAQKHKEQVAETLKAAGDLRGLLYEKGHRLEKLLIEALKHFGFDAAPYKDSTSEFDVVFESAEGRLIGEAEGKDNKAVNIDKLRQLSMNIHEDLQRDSVDTPAKAVLFGNGFRLTPIDERPDPFTDKCKKSSETSSTALVSTPDLFFPLKYLIAHKDEEYAQRCREALLSTSGRVTFPMPPNFKKDE